MALDEKLHEEIPAVDVPPPLTSSPPASGPALLVKLTPSINLNGCIPLQGKNSLHGRVAAAGEDNVCDTESGEFVKTAD